MERKYWIINKDLQCLTEGQGGSYWEDEITRGTKYDFLTATSILQFGYMENIKAHIVEAKELNYENVLEYLKMLLRVGLCFKYVITLDERGNYKVDVIEVRGDDEPTYWKNMKALSKFLIPKTLERIEGACIRHTTEGRVTLYLQTDNVQVEYKDLEGKEGVFRFLG